MIRLTPSVAPARWNRLLERCAYATPFHRYEFLRVLADHTGTTLYPMVGLADGEAVGLFPVFEKRRGPLTLVCSPAPNMKVRYLGPLVFGRGEGSPTERERMRWDFLEAALSCFEERFDPHYVQIRTTDRFGDPRPFAWHDFELRPQYSYVVDITPDPETVVGTFSSDARSNIRGAEDVATTVGGVDVIDSVVDQLTDRHEAQDRSYPVTAAFLRDLYEALPSGVMRPYELRADGEFVVGMITLELGDTIYRWQGGAKTDADVPTDVLDWEIMRSARSRGLARYDLVGANKQRLSRYKSKFDPELVTFQSLVKASRPVKALARLYTSLR